MASADRDPEKVNRSRTGLLWTCSVLCLLIGLFLASDIVGSHHRYGALAWVGVVLSALIIAGLTVVYAACARGRSALDQRVAGRLTVFHLTTIALALALGADILIPDRDTGALALLLPWGIGYWLHNLTTATRRTGDQEPGDRGHT